MKQHVHMYNEILLFLSNTFAEWIQGGPGGQAVGSLGRWGPPKRTSEIWGAFYYTSFFTKSPKRPKMSNCPQMFQTSWFHKIKKYVRDPAGLQDKLGRFFYQAPYPEKVKLNWRRKNLKHVIVHMYMLLKNRNISLYICTCCLKTMIFHCAYGHFARKQQNVIVPMRILLKSNNISLYICSFCLKATIFHCTCVHFASK